MSLSLIAAAAIAAQVPVAPLPAPRALTREEARTDPVDVLARRLLGATGALVRQVTRPPPEPWPGEEWLRTLVMATAPRWSRTAGLCEADLFVLSFQPAGEAAAGQEPPVRVSNLAIVTRYRAIGDPGAAGDMWTEEEQRRFEPACAQSGPVLGEGSRWFGGHAGARGFTSNDAAFAIRTFRQAIVAAASGALPPSACVDDRARSVPRICGDPRATLASLSPDGAGWFDIAPCELGEDRLCVTATVPRNVDELGGQRRIIVTIETDRAGTYPRTLPIGIEKVSLRATTIVY